MRESQRPRGSRLVTVCHKDSDVSRVPAQDDLTHDASMFEAEELCDRVAVIASGRIVAEGSPSALKSRLADRTVVGIEAFGSPGR